MSICWNPTANLDFDDDELYPPPTLPARGSARTKIESRVEPLFISADWVIVASVNGKTIARSSASPTKHTDAAIARWSREMYRRHRVQLESLGVDVELEYTRAGGSRYDL